MSSKPTEKFINNHKIFPVTERFSLSDMTKKSLALKTPNFGFNGLGEVVFRRTYSRGSEDWKDVVIRVIEGVFSIRKDHYKKNSLMWRDEDYQEFASDMANAMFDMRWLPPGRGLWMMGTEFTYNKGSMALNNCFSADTRFITADGVKAFSEFENNDRVVVQQNNRWCQARVRSFGNQEVWNLIVQKGTENKTIKTTANHRWYAKNASDSDYAIVVTSDLRTGQQLKLGELYGTENNVTESWVVASATNTNASELVWCIVEPDNQEFTLEGGILTKNCAATDTTEDLVLSAEWTMDALMNGVGVGFNTMWRGKATKPDKDDTEDYVIPDSREGWVGSLIALLTSYIDSPTYGKSKFPVFDYSHIRKAGLPIKGFGGQSSGPEPLIKLHSRVEGYLDNFCDGFIVVNGSEKKEYNHTRLVADIFNAIGACVVAGNVRRSAEISLGDIEDKTFIDLKNYNKNPERGEIGWMSNNSVILKPDQDFENFSHIPEMAKRIIDNGEPGMINLYNIQKYARYGKESPDKASLANPCFSGDTKIAVADGRGFVRIDQLAKEGRDIPVWSQNPLTGDISIKWGLRPRQTGKAKELVRCHFQDYHIDVTPNHKFYTVDGRTVEAQYLKMDDKIPIFKKSEGDKFDELVAGPTPYIYRNNGQVKICENKACKAEFPFTHNAREKSYCSFLCGLTVRREKEALRKNQTLDVNFIEFTHHSPIPDKHKVYNITVENNHTLCTVISHTSRTDYTGVFVNQCGEIPLCNFELCNLSETFPTRCENSEQYYKALKYSCFYSSTVSLLPTHRPETNAIIAKNRRIGVSISGIAQWACINNDGWGEFNYTKMTSHLRRGYKVVRNFNNELAEGAGVPPSIRVTTVKPSGSISLLAGVTPGVHYPVSRYAIRRMRIGKDSPLVPVLKSAGIPNEPDTYSDNTLVFEFVINHGNVRPCEEVSPWEQFSLVAMMQKFYADNMVSATIYFDKEKDAADVEKMLAMYIPILKSVSMLPHAGHGYKQAPYEPITKEKYDELLEKYGIPNFDSIIDNVPEGSKFCTGDTCML